MVISVGIIGCGYIAHRHAHHIAEHPQIRLHQVWDLDREKAQAFAGKYGCQAAEDEQRFLESQLDLVIVCTPNGTHCASAVSALEAGKHVLVEKPMAVSKVECERMIASAEANERLLFVVKQNRFNPPVQAVKQLIDAGTLGKVFMVNVNCFWNRNAAYYEQSAWRGTRAQDAGTLFTQFSHFVDILYYLFGDIEAVNGIVSNVNHQGLIEFEDTGCFTFRLQNGAMGSFNYTTASHDRNMEGSVTVFAENATLKIGGKYLNAIEYQAPDTIDLSGLPASGPANNYGFYEGSMSNHDKIIHNVVETLNGRETIMTNAYEGMKVVEIIEAFYRSATTV